MPELIPAAPGSPAVCDCRDMSDQGGPPRFWPCPVHGEQAPDA